MPAKGGRGASCRVEFDVATSEEDLARSSPAGRRTNLAGGRRTREATAQHTGTMRVFSRAASILDRG